MLGEFSLAHCKLVDYLHIPELDVDEQGNDRPVQPSDPSKKKTYGDAGGIIELNNGDVLVQSIKLLKGKL